MAVEVVKRLSSSRSFGRGMDSTYTPATYSVLEDGEEVGTLRGSSAEYMQRSTWTFLTREDWYRGQTVFSSFREAKDYLVKRIGKLGDERDVS